MAKLNAEYKSVQYKLFWACYTKYDSHDQRDKTYLISINTHCFTIFTQYWLSLDFFIVIIYFIWGIVFKQKIIKIYIC